MLERQSLTENKAAEAHPAIGRALQIIHDRYGEELSLATIAREAGVSRTVLRDRFVEAFGEPPMRYCARWRMQVAEKMLRDGTDNTSNIAYAVGFNSEAAFNRAFKREFGQPPATWKRMIREQPVRDHRPNELIVSGAPTGVNWVTRHISKLLDRHPELSVRLDPNPRMINFESEAFDCAIRCGKRAPSNLIVDKLFDVHFTPMCTPEFLAAHPKLKNPADLLDVSRITPNDPWWEQWWRHAGVEPVDADNRGVDMGAQVLDALAAMTGQGVALLTPRFWHDELAAGRLIRPFAEALDGGGSYWLVYPRGREAWPKIRLFSDWLLQLTEETAVD